ncbi:MAG: ATP-binding protein [Microcoleus sp. PH2017_10_PVI_O_A]|uniref:AAA family ATPase n=1 Tax=unclassified Microcoleus TaxID=2642155 RepID=UPI001DE2BBD8|nr:MULTISPECIES: AAA family ATPase [unclassified Microcoleus]TAE84541.1 MAG: ATP-binding protein [Oscillatoriales cyanobacterium]MCC3405107.1 ATP-binding protein [Microcoleus sp. PH2017_10_PVI_O_A]MCC3459190.1 ATP-binding protein [Microcoleus sp. PH2017_11_PCY_U_A]MCC3477491.1 ATP-binding protein [Microcoleus sp. PH2017_12_PCY_D_A]MCC3558587.1 ATP-binding protein [Microcoleus sp. PH2017_27_LUM_O_A]
MRIKKVAFWDNELEWRFEPIYFSNLALLVGVSGVGKTQILKGILGLKEIANGASLNGLAWDITFSTVKNVEYRWQGEFETKKNFSMISNEIEEEINKFRIVREHLFKEENVIIERTPNDIIFKGNKTPKLSPFQSVVEILNQEEDISPVQQGFNKIIYSDNSRSSNGIYAIPIRVLSIIKDNIALEDIQASNIPILLKLALIARHYPDVFNKIKSKFIEIFHQVEDVKIEAIENNENPSFPNFPVQIKETGINDWIFQNNISSGMLKTLILISELYLSPEGTLILIDEFENSLGVNCIDVVTDLLWQNRNIQIILTSHHPYIINNISMEYWKIVTRKGGVVTVTDAKDLNLGKSRHQAFTQLINLEEYSEGIKVE